MATEHLDILSFTEEGQTTPIKPPGDHRWKILVVDDDLEVHAATGLVLTGFTFAGRSVELLTAHSGRQARKQLAEHPDIAVLLLDVVMETDHAGLDLVQYVREKLKNSLLRIILRTGQAGQAPERDVVSLYDINDYKEKTELTAQKLYTSILTALRTYRALVGLETNRRGLIKIVEATSKIFEQQSLNQFVLGVLEQVSGLLSLDRDVIYLNQIGVAAKCDRNRQAILGGIGERCKLVGQDPREVLSSTENERIQIAFQSRRTIIGDNFFVGYIATRTGTEAVIYLSGGQPLSVPDRELVELFFRNVTIGLENIELQEDVEATQKEIVYMLGDAVETRSNETGNHVRRVGEYARELALLSGLGEREATVLQAAAPLHDIGKIGIPDSILNHPGRLNDRQWEIMKTHTEKGAKILGKSNRPILQAGAIVAEQHHENWDGTGYPRGSAKEAIHIYGRIVAIADVFDALGAKRCYKPAWEINQILDFLRSESGRKFDPELVDLFVNNLHRFLAIRARFPDQDSSAQCAMA